MKTLISDRVLKSLPNENHGIWNSRCRDRVLPLFATVLTADLESSDLRERRRQA
jgi:hypothetical protein